MNTDHKFIIAINETLEIGTALNAASHLALSLVAQASEEEKRNMHFIDYADAHDTKYPSISALSLIVLRATESELKKLSAVAREQKLLCSEFLETMTGGTYVEQLEKTKLTESPQFFGVAVFGKKDVLTPLTKRLSLYK